jgi:hypothetical protein
MHIQAISAPPHGGAAAAPPPPARADDAGDVAGARVADAEAADEGQARDMPVVVLGGGSVAMGMEEVCACHLGLDLPGDWTVEVPCYMLSSVDTVSSTGNSPAASDSWLISSPGKSISG